MKVKRGKVKVTYNINLGEKQLLKLGALFNLPFMGELDETFDDLFSEIYRVCEESKDNYFVISDELSDKYREKIRNEFGGIK